MRNWRRRIPLARKTLRGNVAVLPSARVEEELKVVGVVVGDCSGLIKGKVCENDKVPSCAQDVFRLYVAVHDALLVALLQALHQLKDEPKLLHFVDKGSR
jgi:hypothetical protein